MSEDFSLFLTITVKNPETGKNEKKAFYKTIVADFIESVLHKLAATE